MLGLLALAVGIGVAIYACCNNPKASKLQITQSKAVRSIK
jgi:hypothetical protein